MLTLSTDFSRYLFEPAADSVLSSSPKNPGYTASDCQCSGVCWWYTAEARFISPIEVLPIAGNELIAAFAAGEAFLVKYRSTRPHY